MCVIMGEMMVSTDVSGMMSVNVPKTTDGDHRKEMCVLNLAIATIVDMTFR